MFTKHLFNLISGLSFTASTFTVLAAPHQQNEPMVMATNIYVDRSEFHDRRYNKDDNPKSDFERDQPYKNPDQTRRRDSKNNKGEDNRGKSRSEIKNAEQPRVIKKQPVKEKSYPGERQRTRPATPTTNNTGNKTPDYRDRSDSGKHRNVTQDTVNHGSAEHRHIDNNIGRHRTTKYRSDRNSRRYRHFQARWYNTRFFTPLHTHYHPIGHRVRNLPRSYVRIMVAGLPFFYYSGLYYEAFNNEYIVIAAPIGATIKVLPFGAIGFTIGLSTYFYVNDTYYMWDEPHQSYRVVNKPNGADRAIEQATKGRLIIYPNRGQDENQQDKDRYECHRWAVTQSDIDPTVEGVDFNNEEIDQYQRAMTACLVGRDYTVK